jgi:hypothetical protein
VRAAVLRNGVQPVPGATRAVSTTRLD